MEQKFPDDVDTVDTVESVPVREEPPKKKRPINGRLITKENAREYALSANQAKARRRKLRTQILAKLTNELDLAEEMRKALVAHDEQYLGMIEKALRICGGHYDQSEEARVQNLNVKSDVNVKKASAVQVVFTDARPEDAEVKVEE